MNTIGKAVDEYIELRRNLGFKMIDEKRMLRRFTEFMEHHQAPYITQALALTWAKLPAEAKPVTHSNRLAAVRSFARYLQAIDPRTEVPAVNLLSPKRQRPRPYLYSVTEIETLLEAARDRKASSAKTALLPLTYSTLLGLLSVTGMRLGETCAMKVADLDFVTATITVRHAKHGRIRLLPLHESTGTMLAHYLEQRRRFWHGRCVSDYLFVSSNGGRMGRGSVQLAFRELSQHIGIRDASGGRSPRIHDLRHTFSVTVLENAYRRGESAEKILPILSTYLGHVQISDTYWYLELSPRLMTETAARLEQCWEGRS